MDELETLPKEEEEAEKEKRTVKDHLLEWGFDFDIFETRARKTKGELREEYGDVADVLKKTLNETKERLVKLAEVSKPAGAELKTGFEKAWTELEKAFKKAEEKIAEDAEKGAEEPAAEEKTTAN